MTTRLTTDADFLDAEREIAKLRAERTALSPSIKTLDDEKRLDGPLSERMWALYDQITLSAPVSLTSAAVKLRLLADPHLGLENNEGENDVASLRQVLELVARVVGAGDAELRALLAEYQRRDRSITERDISEEEVARRCDLAREVRDKIDAIRPTTLRGVLAVLDHGAECQDDPGHWPAQAVEGLREIVGDAEARP